MWRFQRSAIPGCNSLSGVLSAPSLAGKPLGLKTPSQRFHPEASWDTQDTSSTPSSPGEETNAQLGFLCIGLKPDTLSILCYDSYGSENYFRTEASSDLEAEQSLAPKSKCFPWFLGGVVGGSRDDEMQWKPAGWVSVLQSLGTPKAPNSRWSHPLPTRNLTLAHLSTAMSVQWPQFCNQLPHSPIDKHCTYIARTCRILSTAHTRCLFCLKHVTTLVQLTEDSLVTLKVWFLCESPLDFASCYPFKGTRYSLCCW